MTDEWKEAIVKAAMAHDHLHSLKVGVRVRYLGDDQPTLVGKIGKIFDSPSHDPETITVRFNYDPEGLEDGGDGEYHYLRVDLLQRIEDS